MQMNDAKNAPTVLVTPLSGGFPHLRETIAKALLDIGLRPLLLENGKVVQPSGVNVLQAIQRADLLIADITESNPNVMYEIGFAHALRKPVLFLAQANFTKIPTDIEGS